MTSREGGRDSGVPSNVQMMICTQKKVLKLIIADERVGDDVY